MKRPCGPILALAIKGLLTALGKQPSLLTKAVFGKEALVFEPLRYLSDEMSSMLKPVFKLMVSMSKTSNKA